VNDFIVNPRKSPRLPARCRVTVAHAGAGWLAETEDLSPGGCQIVSPRPLEVGRAARLIIESARVPNPLSVLGRIAWMAGEGRHRAGVSFSERQAGVDPGAWFRKLLVSQPDPEGVLHRVPDRLAAATALFLRPPPQHILDFTPDEVRVLKLLEDGTTIERLLKGPLAPAQVSRVVFALLDRRILTLSLGEAAPAWRWKAALSEIEAQAPSRRGVESPPGRATPRPWIPPPVESLVPSAAPRAAPAQALAAYATHAAPRRWRPGGAPAPARQSARPAEAQECFDRAVSAVSAGEFSGAIALLRRALSLSPRDPEVAALLGQIAFAGNDRA